MQTEKSLSCFFSAIASDGRVSIAHIGLFAALLKYRMDHGFTNPIQVYSYQIMEIAKISARATYHKCIRELSEYGYINYCPSYKCNQASKIYFPDGTEQN